MAKRGRKSQAIRDYLSQNPGAMPKDIIAGLKAQGTKVSPALVSNVKYGGNMVKATKKAVGRKPASAAAITADDLMQAKELADQLGGVGKAKEALETLERLR